YDIAGNAGQGTKTYRVVGLSSGTGGSGGSGGSSGGTSMSPPAPIIYSGQVANLVTLDKDLFFDTVGFTAAFSENAALSIPIVPSTSRVQEVSGGGKIVVAGTSEDHTLTVKDLQSTYVSLLMKSDPIAFNLTIGEAKDVDIDKDGIAELNVKLNSIKSGKADITIKKIQPTTAEPVQQPSEQPTTNVGKNNNIKWWIVGLIVLIAVIGVIIWQKRK
ncbi:MAG: hypothetical protein AABY22_33910, partial [Nanoarchaeota archaeon]